MMNYKWIGELKRVRFVVSYANFIVCTDTVFNYARPGYQ